MCSHLCLLSFYILFIFTDGASEGDLCKRGEKAGVCRNLNYCQEAIDGIDSELIRPQFCGFSDAEAIVCCLDEVKPIGYKPLRCSDRFNSSIPDDLNANRIGRKAREKCIEYQESLVYPCQKQVGNGDAVNRSDHCQRDPTRIQQSAGRVEYAKYGEYPHMVLVAVNNTGLVVTEAQRYICSGVLLSEKFVMTFEQCSSKVGHPDRPAKYVLLNALNRLTTLDSANARWYLIGKIHHHPDFKPSSFYHDLVLLETETEMQLDQFSVPACLPVFSNMEAKQATFLGWGISTFDQEFIRDPLQPLKKVTLDKYSTSTCKSVYYVQVPKYLKDGIKESTQVCYGTEGKNTGSCQGNAGAALVVENQDVHCMYTVIGILSFGKGCGAVNKPDVFVRIAGYIEWIENIVWP